MNVTVRELRRGGVRRGDHDLAKDEGVAGDLTFSAVGNYTQLKLANTGDTHMVPLIPVLYDAQCVGISGRIMIWRGYQREGSAENKNAPTFLQEWSVTVADRA